MSYSRYKLAKTGSMTSDIWLYTEFKENWQYFFTETNMTPDAPGDVDKMVQVKEHKRRRYPGDAGTTVGAHGRFFVRNAKTKGSARPGKTYTIIEKGALGSTREVRQFSILGDDFDIAAYARAKAKFEVVIKGENGWNLTVPGAAGGTLAATTSGGTNP